jgi:hypothetical protein
MLTALATSDITAPTGGFAGDGKPDVASVLLAANNDIAAAYCCHNTVASMAGTTGVTAGTVVPCALAGRTAGGGAWPGVPKSLAAGACSQGITTGVTGAAMGAGMS